MIVKLVILFSREKKNLGVAATLVKASAFKIFNFQLDLTLKDGKGGDISSFIPNGEWDLIGKINFLLELTFLNLHEKHSNFVIKKINFSHQIPKFIDGHLFWRKSVFLKLDFENPKIQFAQGTIFPRNNLSKGQFV